jgi:hypothetical protein
MSASSHGRVTLNEATTPNGGGNNNKLRASSVFGLDQNQGKKIHFSFHFVNRENVGRGLLFIHTAILNRLFVVASFWVFFSLFCSFHFHTCKFYFIIAVVMLFRLRLCTYRSVCCYAACVFSFDLFLTRHPSCEKILKIILNMRIDDADDDICFANGATNNKTQNK